MSGQPNLGALGGGDWRATISEQARRQNLINNMTPILQGLSEQHSGLVMNIAYQCENQAFTTAKSSQEYLMHLNNQIMEISQRVKSIAANPVSGASAGTNAAGQSPAAANPAVALMQSIQFNQQTTAPTQTQLQTHGQAQPQQAQPHMQPQPQVSVQGTPAGAQPSTDSIIPQIRNIIQNPDNYSIQDIGMAI
ncbi:hypothetical protein LPJ74_001372, partial [Coemansia sp. RSA 1843]